MVGSCSCGRRWNALAQAHCSICHNHFSTVDNFDRHVPSYKGCKNPATMTNRRGMPFFEAVEKVGGIVYQRPYQSTASTPAIP